MSTLSRESSALEKEQTGYALDERLRKKRKREEKEATAKDQAEKKRAKTEEKYASEIISDPMKLLNVQ